MFLGAALQELKTMQSKLSRLYDLRSDTFNYLENKEFEIDFNQITEEINELVKEIRRLKVQIAKTNNASTVEVDGKEISIQELIFLIGDLRSDLNQMDYLEPKGPVYLGGQAVEYIPQKRRDQIAEMISEMEEKKADFDKLLQSKNWSTELSD